MKYEKNQYSEGISLCTLIIAGVFLYWGVSILIGGGWVPWWGIIPLGIGIIIAAGQIAVLANRGKLRNAVKYEYIDNPNASIEEISKKTSISKKDVQAITLDLKIRGDLRGKFSTKTGVFKTIPDQVNNKASEQIKRNFCANCGSPIKKDHAEFCAFCGSKIE